MLSDSKSKDASVIDEQTRNFVRNINQQQKPIAVVCGQAKDPLAFSQDIIRTKDESLASANISVETTDKNVELSGTVPTQAAKDRAEQIAKEHSGSLTIKNHIRVENNPPGSKQ